MRSSIEKINKQDVLCANNMGVWARFFQNINKFQNYFLKCLEILNEAHKASSDESGSEARRASIASFSWAAGPWLFPLKPRLWPPTLGLLGWRAGWAGLGQLHPLLSGVAKVRSDFYQALLHSAF